MEPLGPIAAVGRDQLWIDGGYKGAWQSTASGFPLEPLIHANAEK
jgi:hypothetical protein